MKTKKSEFENLPKSCKEAKLLNAPLYFLNRECPNGHNLPRHVDNGECFACRIDKKKKYHEKITALTHEIITRDEAAKKGLRYYFTGEKCANGHIAVHTTNDYGCVVCRQAHKKNWVEKLKQEIKETASLEYQWSALEARIKKWKIEATYEDVL